MKGVVIYGAGDYGRKLYSFLRTLGCHIDYFIQSDEPKEDSYEGIEIISFKKFIKDRCKYTILIAIKDTDIVNSIVQKFKEVDGNLYILYDCGKFIEENYLRMSGIYPKGDKICLLCNNEVRSFLAGGIQNEFFDKVKVIGGGYREDVRCPYCGSMDRNRWAYWILQKETDIFTQSCRVLHFAPEEGIRKKIEENKLCDYYAGDIVLKKGVHYVDVTDIPFKNDFFDYIIINHVLEHVKDENKAFEELKRVLKEDGRLILSFPIAKQIETLEVKTFNDEERLQKYGQKDHIRLYGRDYRERIEKHGFIAHEYIPNQILEGTDIIKYGFLKEDILLICERN